MGHQIDVLENENHHNQAAQKTDLLQRRFHMKDTHQSAQPAVLLNRLRPDQNADKRQQKQQPGDFQQSRQHRTEDDQGDISSEPLSKMTEKLTVIFQHVCSLPVVCR